LDWMNRIF